MSLPSKIIRASFIWSKLHFHSKYVTGATWEDPTCATRRVWLRATRSVTATAPSAASAQGSTAGAGSSRTSRADYNFLIMYLYSSINQSFKNVNKYFWSLIIEYLKSAIKHLSIPDWGNSNLCAYDTPLLGSIYCSILEPNSIHTSAV